MYIYIYNNLRRFPASFVALVGHFFNSWFIYLFKSYSFEPSRLDYRISCKGFSLYCTIQWNIPSPPSNSRDRTTHALVLSLRVPFISYRPLANPSAEGCAKQVEQSGLKFLPIIWTLMLSRIVLKVKKTIIWLWQSNRTIHRRQNSPLQGHVDPHGPELDADQDVLEVVGVALYKCWWLYTISFPICRVLMYTLQWNWLRVLLLLLLLFTYFLGERLYWYDGHFLPFLITCLFDDFEFSCFTALIGNFISHKSLYKSYIIIVTATDGNGERERGKERKRLAEFTIYTSSSILYVHIIS